MNRPTLEGSNLDARLPQNTVVFCIPLKAKASARNWSLIVENLQRTITSVRASTDRSFHILVVGHDEPEGVSGKDVTFVRAMFGLPEPDLLARRRDKFSKRHLGAIWAGWQADGPIWIMHLDADDLVHKDLVGFARGAQNNAFILGRGYRYYLNTGELQRYLGFHKYCGSTFLGRFSPHDLPLNEGDRFAPIDRFVAHPRAFRIAQQLRMSPGWVPFPGAVYMVNHEESLQTGKRGTRTANTRRNRIVLPREEAELILRNEFGFSPPPA